MTLLCAALAIGAQSPKAPSAAEILARTGRAYNALRSYSDTGRIVMSTVTNGREKVDWEDHFKTWFAIPSRLRFDYWDIVEPDFPGDHLVIWPAKDGYALWSIHRVVGPASKKSPRTL